MLVSRLDQWRIQELSMRGVQNTMIGTETEEAEDIFLIILPYLKLIRFYKIIIHFAFEVEFVY